ncbi:excinuclease ATPase subunit [Arsukibacterium indicum]|uniref:Excinuclease ATPase subunit n=1 Tax=Arsukibacterium indicum TaxID=2848612 RepID=A0ABS6MR55_9GAMM|nr:excinuclease ATPase subunit [Arsukibacterium indicum]MBV2130894.1 excinuclease ATPase subunit [Arsukibacterium indicum]
MEIQSAFNAGLQGFQRASTGITEATVNINRQTTANREQVAAAENDVRQAEAPEQNRPTQPQAPSVEQSLVQLTSESRNAEANVRSVQAADQALGTIIDVRV